MVYKILFQLIPFGKYLIFSNFSVFKLTTLKSHISVTKKTRNLKVWLYALFLTLSKNMILVMNGFDFFFGGSDPLSFYCISYQIYIYINNIYFCFIKTYIEPLNLFNSFNSAVLLLSKSSISFIFYEKDPNILFIINHDK